MWSWADNFLPTFTEKKEEDFIEVIKYLSIYEMEFMKYSFPDPQKCCENAKKARSAQVVQTEMSDVHLIPNRLSAFEAQSF